MKKILILLMIVMLSACSSSESTQTEEIADNEDTTIYPYTLTEEEKEDFKAGLRNYWYVDLETVNFDNPTVKKYYCESPDQIILVFTEEMDTPFYPGSDYASNNDSMDTPDFMDGIRDTYYGMFFSVDEIIRTDEHTYVANGINYEPWEFFCEGTGFDKIEYFAIRIEDPQTSDELTLFLADDPDCGVVFVRKK